MKIYLGSTSSNDAPYYGPLIRWRTKGKFNHSLVLFELEDGSLEYFESHWKKAPSTGRTGVRGPLPYEKLLKWEAEKKSHKLSVKELPYTSDQAQQAFRFAINAVGKYTYAYLQILHNLEGLYRVNGSPDKFTCCEYVAQCIARCSLEDTYNIILRKGYRTFDMIYPAGTNGLYEDVEKIRKKHGC